MRVQITYRGRVQGVGFRATAREVARGWPVTGFVRNEADGTVWMEVQGESAAVEGMLLRLSEVMGRNIQRADRRDTAELRGETTFEVAR